MKTLKILESITANPGFDARRIKALMERLNLNHKSFALVMNVVPHTVKLWTAGAVRPCNISQRLMQIYELCPEIIAAIAHGDTKTCGHDAR